MFFRIQKDFADLVPNRKYAPILHQRGVLTNHIHESRGLKKMFFRKSIALLTYRTLAKYSKITIPIRVGENLPLRGHLKTLTPRSQIDQAINNWEVHSYWCYRHLLHCNNLPDS